MKFHSQTTFPGKLGTLLSVWLRKHQKKEGGLINYRTTLSSKSIRIHKYANFWFDFGFKHYPFGWIYILLTLSRLKDYLIFNSEIFSQNFDQNQQFS